MAETESNENTNGKSASTVTVKEQVAVLPDWSVAVYVTTVKPALYSPLALPLPEPDVAPTRV